jgi:hypothetical protein
MKRALVLIAFAAMLALPAAAGGTKYKPEEFRDPATVAKKNLDLSLKKLKKLNIKKLAILECYGEFVVSREVTDNQLGTIKSSSIDINKDYYTNTANRVYDDLVALLEKNGIAVVTKEQVQSNPTYKDWSLKEEKEGRGVTSGMFKPTKVSETQKISTTGLGIFPGAFGMMKVAPTVAQVTAELGADGFLQVWFKVDIGKKFAPVLSAFEIKMSTDLRSQEVGFSGHKSLRYDFYTQWEQIANLREGIISEADVRGAEKGSLDLAKYDAELMGMLTALENALSYSIHELLPENTPIIRQSAPVEGAGETAPQGQ